MLAVLIWALQRTKLPETIERRGWFLLACAGYYICFVALGPWTFLRYLSPLLPYPIQ